MLDRVLAAPCPIQLSANVPGKAGEDDQVLPAGVPSSWIQAGPQLAVVANWAVNQQIEDLSVYLSLSLVQIEKYEN